MLRHCYPVQVIDGGFIRGGVGGEERRETIMGIFLNRLFQEWERGR